MMLRIDICLSKSYNTTKDCIKCLSLNTKTLHLDLAIKA